MELVGAAVTKNTLSLKKKLKNLEARDTEYYAKSYEKCKILSEFLETLALKFSFW